MKKFLLGIAAVAAVTLGGAPAGATDYPAGDANCSGAVTMADVNLVFATYLQKPGLPAIPGECGARVDMNCDSAITAADANITYQIYLQNPVEYPASC